jgi:hypothetical protein
MAKINPVRIKVPARISFVKLAKPEPDMNNKGTEYSVECRTSKEDTATLKMIRDAMKKVLIEACGEKTDKWPFNFRAKDFFETYLSPTGQDGFFLRDGDAKENEEYHGLAFFTARSFAKTGKTPYQPPCGKMLGEGRWVKLTGEKLEEEIYSGCYADVVIDVYWYDNADTKKKGIGASLKAVMKTADGERLSGSAPVNMNEFFGEEGSADELEAGEDDNYNV